MNQHAERRIKRTLKHKFQPYREAKVGSDRIKPREKYVRTKRLNVEDE